MLMTAWLRQWWPYAVFALGLAAILAFPTFGPSYEDCSASHHKQYADPEKGKPSPEVHRTFSEGAAVFVECEGEVIHANEGVILAVSTIFLALFTLALWRSTDRLWEAGEKQLALSADTARRQLRAYLFLDPGKNFSIARGASTTATIEIEIHVKNLGATPAHGVTVESWMALDVWPPPESFSFKGPPDERGRTQSVVAPGAVVHYHTGTARPMTPEELADVQSGNRSVYVYGRIEYLDVFNKPHWTNFCQASTTLHREGFSTHWANTDAHNDADIDKALPGPADP
jgi:hypothetical protein